MTKPPVYQPTLSSEQAQIKALRKSKFDAFAKKYPLALVAWIERQPDKTFWRAMFDLMLPPDRRILIVTGKGRKISLPVSAQDLWDCYYRAALTMLVQPKRGRPKGDFTEIELASAFKINPGRYRNLVTREKAWLRRVKIKTFVIDLPALTASQPDIEDLRVSLLSK